MSRPSPLPPGFVVGLAPGVQRLDDGRVLVGGSPLTAMRLAVPVPEGGRLVVTDRASSLVAERLLATNLALPALDAVPPMSADDLTVVVPVRDRPAQLDRCLAALAPLRVIVVDDASRDPASVAAVAARHGAAVVALSTNLGPAGARNAGLARVTTPLVAFVDSDVEAPASELLALTRQLADPSVVLVGPRVVGQVRSTAPSWFERYDAAASSLDLGPRPSAVRPGATVAWLPSACLVGRTASLAGGFDTAMRVGEDVDLVWRLVGAGRRVRYDPAVTVRHDVRGTVRGWLRRKVLYGTSGALLAERHGGNVAPAVLSPAVAVAGAAILLRRRWALPVAGAALAHAAMSVAGALPGDLPAGPRARVATMLAVRGLGWTVRQEASLLVRHWWPVAALGCLLAPVRRAMATALVADSAVALWQHRDTGLDAPTVLAARRLDDAAYGLGLWQGAWRARSWAALRPRRPGDGSRRDATFGRPGRWWGLGGSLLGSPPSSRPGSRRPAPRTLTP